MSDRETEHEVARDAARYRFLRDQAAGAEVFICYRQRAVFTMFHGEPADELVDRAMEP